MAPKATSKTRKRAASNVAEIVTTKRARKAKQPAPPEDPELVEREKGGKGIKRGKEKRGEGNKREGCWEG